MYTRRKSRNSFHVQNFEIHYFQYRYLGYNEYFKVIQKSEPLISLPLISQILGYLEFCFGPIKFEIAKFDCTVLEFSYFLLICRYTAGNGPVVKEMCDNCGFRYNVGGPVWAEEMHSPDFIQRVIDSVEKEKERFHTNKRIVGMLSVIKEELHDVPFYYTTDGLCGVLHCEMLSFTSLRY
jgi:tRNA G26 N,N-dimethylase Trm1